MAGVAINGSQTNDVVANDISYRVWDPCKSYSCDSKGNCSCVGGYWYYSGGSSTIRGTVVASSTNVFVNRIAVARQDDNVTETDSPSVSGEPTANHTGGTGKITVGNAKNVFSGGKSVAMIGSIVDTHSTPNTTVKTGSSNVFIGG